jgi:toxin YoeB
MEVTITAKAKEDLVFWRKSGNFSIQNKISKLIASTLATPYEGLGKPEPLKYELSGTWSRRINKEHRMVYEVENNKIVILSLKGHYE